MMMVWDALVAQTQANRDLVHLAMGEAQLMQAAANRDTATTLLTLVKGATCAEQLLGGQGEARGCHDVPCQEDELPRQHLQ